MYWDVVDVRALPQHRIHVRLKDGREGVFNLAPYLDRGLFRELRDPNYFNQVGIVLGAVTWPHQQDIAPETLLAGLEPVASTIAN